MTNGTIVIEHEGIAGRILSLYASFKWTHVCHSFSPLLHDEPLRLSLPHSSSSSFFPHLEASSFSCILLRLLSFSILKLQALASKESFEDKFFHQVSSSRPCTSRWLANPGFELELHSLTRKGFEFSNSTELQILFFWIKQEKKTLTKTLA